MTQSLIDYTGPPATVVGLGGKKTYQLELPYSFTNTLHSKYLNWGSEV